MLFRSSERERERERGRQSERGREREIGREREREELDASLAQDRSLKAVKVTQCQGISHLVCLSLWFMDWERSTGRNTVPLVLASTLSLSHTHTHIHTADWALWVCSTYKQKACCLPSSLSLSLSLSLSPSLYFPLSVRSEYLASSSI